MPKAATKKILRELDVENVTSADFINCFRDHVHGGFALNGNFALTKELIKAADPSPSEKATIRELALEGIHIQEEKKNEEAAKNYRSIVRLCR